MIFEEEINYLWLLILSFLMVYIIVGLLPEASLIGKIGFILSIIIIIIKYAISTFKIFKIEEKINDSI